VTPDEALRLVADGACVLDVRSPAAFEGEGHLPGALLLPMDRLAAAPAVVADDGRAILVVDGDGVRSRRAAAFLAEAGVPRVHHLAGGLRGWTGALGHERARPSGPSPWFLENARLAPRGARALDVACGRGRHALVLAQAGSFVRAVDRDAARVDALRALARRLHLPVTAEVLDLEAADVTLGEDAYDLVLVFNYLHRPIFPALVRALAPGGLLLCETFTREHARHGGRPSSPEHLLEPGELRRLVEPLQVVGHREDGTDGRHLAAVAARKPFRPSRSNATSHAAAARSVAATPPIQNRPARSRAVAASGGARTPGARKR
jgi:rhodanese-related sulfurtransferase